MAEVIELKCKQKRRMVNVKAPAYYCVRCDADLFRLSMDGDVMCASCGSWMSNLIVGPRDAA